MFASVRCSKVSMTSWLKLVTGYLWCMAGQWCGNSGQRFKQESWMFVVQHVINPFRSEAKCSIQSIKVFKDLQSPLKTQVNGHLRHISRLWSGLSALELFTHFSHTFSLGLTTLFFLMQWASLANIRIKCMISLIVSLISCNYSIIY